MYWHRCNSECGHPPLFFLDTRRKRRPHTEFHKLAAEAARECRRPAPHHKHPVLRGTNRESSSRATTQVTHASLLNTTLPLAAEAARECRRPAPHHKHPVLRGTNRESSSRATTQVTHASLLNTTLPRVGGRVKNSPWTLALKSHRLQRANFNCCGS